MRTSWIVRASTIGLILGLSMSVETISPSFLGHFGCSRAHFKEQKKPQICHGCTHEQP